MTTGALGSQFRCQQIALAERALAGTALVLGSQLLDFPEDRIDQRLTVEVGVRVLHAIDEEGARVQRGEDE